MFSLNPMKELYESPLPPMALTDYEAFSKFLNQALHCCHETGRDFNVYLDWAIRALASSMAADSAARIFLPKTRTAPFSLDDLDRKSTRLNSSHNLRSRMPSSA